MKKNKTIVILIISLLLPHLAGLIGSFFTAPAIPTWYASLEKPFFNPPSWLFAPVWLTLYTLMGIALFLIWRKGLKREEARFAFFFFLVHLLINSAWSILFFGMQNPLIALLDITFLWLMILVLIIQFWKISKPAAYLLIPYFAWVSFASILNFSLWWLNK